MRQGVGRQQGGAYPIRGAVFRTVLVFVEERHTREECC